MRRHAGDAGKMWPCQAGRSSPHFGLLPLSALGAAAVNGEGARGEGSQGRPRPVSGPLNAGLEGAPGCFKIAGKSAILASGVGTSLAARPRFLEPELDSDPHLPGGPGPFHV